jgi:CBS domain-containing protein
MNRLKSSIREVLDAKPIVLVTIAPEETVRYAVREMNLNNVGALPVLTDERLIGIFTERDVLVRVVEAGLNPNTTRVSDVMTANPLCVAMSATVEDTMILMTENHCRHIPVLTENKLTGLVSIGDLTRWMVRDQDVTLAKMLRAMRVAAND